MQKWLYKDEEFTEIPEDAYGFVYKLTNLDNGKIYIGKKKFFSITNPETSEKRYRELKEAGEPVKRTKDKKRSTKGNIVWKYKRKNVKKESNWRSYMSSSDEVKKDVKAGNDFKREILEVVPTKSQLTYFELKHQFIEEVLENDSYNSNILGKFYPKIFVVE